MRGKGADFVETLTRGEGGNKERLARIGRVIFWCFPILEGTNKRKKMKRGA